MYLKLDQTTQATLGTLTFPNVKATTNLRIGKFFIKRKHTNLSLRNSDNAFVNFLTNQIYAYGSIITPQISSSNSSIIITGIVFFNTSAASTSILGGNAFETATGANQNGGNVIIRGGNKVGTGVFRKHLFGKSK